MSLEALQAGVMTDTLGYQQAIQNQLGVQAYFKDNTQKAINIVRELYPEIYDVPNFLLRIEQIKKHL